MIFNYVREANIKLNENRAEFKKLFHVNFRKFALIQYFEK